MAILSDSACKLDGLLLPGHVSTITGKNYFNFLKQFKVSGVIAGFDALSIMEAIYLLVKFANDGTHDIVNNLTSSVTDEGNTVAMGILHQVFESCDAQWRGVGVIPESGLCIRDQFSDFDVVKKFRLPKVCVTDPSGCRCGEILMGKTTPKECRLFGKSCTPSTPVGPCMVSSEGTCAAYFKYGV